jgi:tetratricopeptide (TPR) repeat protein
MPNERRVLDSWKEIAAYLGRSEKTCREWERKNSLPVHRLTDSPKAHVFAYAEELDEWKEQAGRPPVNEKPEVRVRPVARWTALAAGVAAVVFAVVGLAVWRPWEKTGDNSAKAAPPSAARPLAVAGPQSSDALRLADRRSGPAYECYLKGRYHLERGGKKGFRTAIAHFQEALDTDPLFAEAYAGLASGYYLLASNFYLAPREADPLAKAAALKAIELDEGIAEAHIVLGCVLGHYEWDLDQAEKEIRRAIALAPDFAHAHHMFAFLSLQRGRTEEAIREIEEAHSLDPLSQRITANAGCLLLLAGRHDQAEEHLAMILRQDPANGIALAYYSEVLAVRGRYREAVESGRRAVELLGGDNWVELLVALYHARSGERAEAEEILARLERVAGDEFVSSAMSAAVYEALGDKEKAFALLEKAILERDFDVNWLMCAPEYGRLREDPRFVKMIPWLSAEERAQHLSRLGAKEGARPR